MLQSVVNVRFDEDLKKQLDSVCSELGITVSSAITLFAKKVVREKRIPFTLSLESDTGTASFGVSHTQVESEKFKQAMTEIEKLGQAMEALKKQINDSEAHSLKTQHKTMNLKTAIIFKDYMVIQREKPFVIWGTGKPGQEVTVSIQGKTGRAHILPDGTWKAVLPALHTSDEELLSISTEDESLTFQKVAVGEVWLAGGQSNMEFHMRYDADKASELSDCKNANIRFFDFPEISYPEQLTDFDYSRFGYWRTCDEENLEYFSAVGYYFAKRLQNELTIPVGIIGCNYGGSPSCAWLSEETVQKTGPVWLEEFKNGLAGIDIESYKKEFRSNPMNDRSDPFSDPFGEMMLYPTTREFQLELMSRAPADYGGTKGPYDPWRPCGLFETMLKPLVPYGIRGFLWYQGESDDAHAELYKNMLTALINEWRGLWREQLPFLLVQLAPFEAWLDCHGTHFPELRSHQEQVADNLPDVYMASIGDVGMRYDIHPKKKQPVGTRLALLALGHVYKKDIVCDAPRAAMISGNDEVVIEFEHAKNLSCGSDSINALSVYGDGQPIDDFTARLDGSCIILSGSEISQAQQIRVSFAKTDYYEVNLYNEAGIPAVPFELVLEK